MFTTAMIVVGTCAVILLSAITARMLWSHSRHEAALARARELFYRRREWLEAKFVTLASQSGKPRGLSWSNCDFENDVAFARDRSTGQLRALVGVTISFEAIEGGGMEDNPNVGNLRAATSVFQFDGKQWLTDGRAVFNLNPAETIDHFQDELEMVDL